MKYCKFILILSLLIFLLHPVSSQQLNQNNKFRGLPVFKLKDTDTNKTTKKKLVSPNRRYEFFVSLNVGGDPEAYSAFGASIAFHIAPIIDLRTGMDGYIGNDYGDGLKQKYNVAYFGMYIAEYVYKDIIRTSVGGGVALLIRKLNDNDKKYHPYVNIKGEYYFTKNFGFGAEVKYYIKSIYANSSALYFLNGNIKF
jgi:hypothetical protein